MLPFFRFELLFTLQCNWSLKWLIISIWYSLCLLWIVVTGNINEAEWRRIYSMLLFEFVFPACNNKVGILMFILFFFVSLSLPWWPCLCWFYVSLLTWKFQCGPISVNSLQVLSLIQIFVPKPRLDFPNVIYLLPSFVRSQNFDFKPIIIRMMR